MELSPDVRDKNVRVESCICLHMLLVMSNKYKKILLKNSICKSLLQGVIASEMPKMLLFTHIAYIGIHFVFIHEFVVRVRQLSLRSSDGYSVAPAA